MTNGTSAGAFGWLGNVNNLLTTFGAIVAAIAATFSAINKAAIERVDSKVKDLTFREQKEKLSATFADVFLKTVLPDPQIKENPKHVQALLSILNIIAQASASGTGKMVRNP